MVIFKKTSDNKHVDLMTDDYKPMFSVEIFKVCAHDPEHLATLLESIQEHNWDLIFIIMMYDCPEEVKVDHELREDTLKEIFGYSQNDLSKEMVEEEIQHKHPNKHVS